MGVRPAPVRGPVPLGAHAGVVLNHRIENGRQQPAGNPRVAPKPIEHELRDRGIADQLGPAKHLEVA